MLVDRLSEATDNKWVAQEALGRLREDFHRFRQRCETYKALAVALVADNRPVAGRRVARVLQGGGMLSKVLAHMCDAWSVQSWDAQDQDAAALAALGVA